MLDPKFKNLLIGGLSAIAVLSLYIIFSPFQQPGAYSLFGGFSDDEASLRAGMVSTVTNDTPSLPITMTYQDALLAYDYRFQFKNCSGNPGSINVAKGSPIMLDNRDAVSHKIAVGDQVYNVAAYEFAIATAGPEGGYFITCDGGGAARLFVY